MEHFTIFKLIVLVLWTAELLFLFPLTSINIVSSHSQQLDLA